MIPFGAPYVDKNNNGQYDPGIDKPGIKNAEQTLFGCLTDGFPETHSVGEGFGGGTLPVMAQVQLTAWGYNIPGLEDVQFVKWVIINKNSGAWDSLHFSLVVDPDIGWADDDYIGCDTTLNLGYCYNGDDDDNKYQHNPFSGSSETARTAALCAAARTRALRLQEGARLLWQLQSLWICPRGPLLAFSLIFRHRTRQQCQNGLPLFPGRTESLRLPRFPQGRAIPS